VTEVNAALADNPALLNQDPHGAAWLIKLKLDDPKEVEHLMSAEEYDEFVRSAEEEH